MGGKSSRAVKAPKYLIVNAIIISSRLFIMPAEFGDGAEVRGIAPPFFPGLGVDDGSGLPGVTSAPGSAYETESDVKVTGSPHHTK
jgi:hypothetical protein